MAKYRKKPVVIDAVQLRWGTWDEMCDHLGPKDPTNWEAGYSDTYSDTCGDTCEPGMYMKLEIKTLEGVMTASHGDYVIRGISGELYPCKPDIFNATYEAVAA